MNFGFCTSVNSSPTSMKGSDIFLVPWTGTVAVRNRHPERGRFSQTVAQFLETGAIRENQADRSFGRSPGWFFDSKQLREWITAILA